MKSPSPLAGLGSESLHQPDYEALAAFRYEVRCFLVFSERAARAAGLTPQQHQALLAIRAATGEAMTVGRLAERLVIEPHSASGLATRLVQAGLIERSTAKDKRVGNLRLTHRAYDLLEDLSRAHHLEIRRLKKVLSSLLDEFGDAES